MSLQFKAIGPDKTGRFYAGYWSGGIHREPEFRPMAECSSMAQAEDAANLFNKEQRRREELMSAMHMALDRRRIAHGFYEED